MLNKLCLLILFFCFSCKVQDGDNTLNECSSPNGCFEEYLACDETIYYHTHESKLSNISNAEVNAVFAQSFEMQRSETLSSFTIALQSIGAATPKGEAHMQLREDCEGNPCPASLAVSSAFDMAQVEETITSDTNTEVNFSFASQPSLKAGKIYWALIFLPLDGQTDAEISQKTNHFDVYSLGSFRTSNNNGASWNDSSSQHDAFLKVNVCI